MDAVITSASNPAVKMVRKLISSAKSRREINQFVAEGIHLTKSFLESGGQPVLLICAVSAMQNQEIIELVESASARGTDVLVFTDSLFESIASVHAPVGVMMVFSPVRSEWLNQPLSENALLLEAVQDPGNLGTILRTAAAVGVSQVLLSPDSASPWSPKALRAGMGAQFSLAVHEGCDLRAIAKEASIPVLATALALDGVLLYDIDLSTPVAWVLGNEGQGVSKELAELASERVMIPQVQSAVESLNVSAAAAVCLYEQYRQASQRS